MVDGKDDVIQKHSIAIAASLNSVEWKKITVQV